jgi:hypothetical protein
VAGGTVSTTAIDVDEWRAEGLSMNEPSDLERSRLLFSWLQARRAVDDCLSNLVAAGPAGERRVREQLALVDDLEERAHAAFDRYRLAAEGADDTAPVPRASARRPRLNIVRALDRASAPEALPSTPDTDLVRSILDTKSARRRRR